MASSQPTEPKRLLVLATSGAFGGGFRGADVRVWPETVRDGLAAVVGDVELTKQRFYVHAGDPLGLLERKLVELQPDYIVMQGSAWPATQKTVANRVSRLLGKRAGDWTEARVLTVDRSARHKGMIRHNLNNAGRRVARKVIGTAPLTDVPHLMEKYLKVLDRIAMMESAEIVVVGTSYPSNAARRNNPKVDEIKSQFDRELSAAAHRKRLKWVNSAAVSLEAEDPESTFLDMLHKDLQWHEGLAAHVVAALLPELGLAAARAYQSSQS